MILSQLSIDEFREFTSASEFEVEMRKLFFKDQEQFHWQIIANNFDRHTEVLFQCIHGQSQRCEHLAMLIFVVITFLWTVREWIVGYSSEDRLLADDIYSLFGNSKDSIFMGLQNSLQKQLIRMQVYQNKSEHAFRTLFLSNFYDVLAVADKNSSSAPIANDSVPCENLAVALSDILHSIPRFPLTINEQLPQVAQSLFDFGVQLVAQSNQVEQYDQLN